MFRIFKGEGFVPDFTQDVHYISWTPYAGNCGGYHASGYSSMFWSYAITCRALNISEESAIKIFEYIDRKSETGTFYPKAPITIMPNCRRYSDWEIFSHFDDAFECQNNLVKAENVIFDMRNYTYYMPNGEPSNGEYAYMIDYWHRKAWTASMQERDRRYFFENYFLLVSKISDVLPGNSWRSRRLDTSLVGDIRELNHLCRFDCIAH